MPAPRAPPSRVTELLCLQDPAHGSLPWAFRPTSSPLRALRTQSTIAVLSCPRDFAPAVP